MERILKRVATGLALVLMGAGLVVIAGWQYRIPLLKGEALGTFVAPNTAVCFIACGLSILLQMQRLAILRAAGNLIAVLLTLFSASVIVEYLLHVNLRIDRVFLANRLADWNLPDPGRFSWNTAMAFGFAGLSLILLRRKKGMPAELFGLLVLLVSYVSVIGYLYNVKALYSQVMAIHTAVLLAVLAVALGCAAARHPILDILLSSYAGGIAARRMVFAIVTLMPVIGFISLWSHSSLRGSIQFRTALGDSIAVVLFTILALHTAATMNEVDRKRRRSEAALMRSEKLSTAGRMAATVAHEVNNPLEAVSNLIYLLKNENLAEEDRREYLRLAEQEVERVAAIARRTLGFYKDRSGPSEVVVSEVVRSVLEVYGSRWVQKQIMVSTSSSGEATITVSRGELQQVLANLVANAIDALPNEGGRLDISERISDGILTIEVRDNGHGISDENLPRIFEPFFSTNKEVGTGLGLWVSRELVQKNGGTIEVTSSTRKSDHGTTFLLSFPASKRQPDRAQGFSAADCA